MCKEIIKSKREIRNAVLKIRNDLSVEERRRAALLLTERILGHQWFYRSDYFLCFVSYGSEISTEELLKEALRAGKKVYVPKVIIREEGEQGESTEMEFYRIFGLDELKKGYKGIPEPLGNSEKYTCSEAEAERTLMLMPGAAFDRYRNRLGYGKGFYDRFLADKEALQLRTIAVGYGCQVVEQLPVSDTDIRPYQVICV